MKRRFTIAVATLVATFSAPTAGQPNDTSATGLRAKVMVAGWQNSLVHAQVLSGEESERLLSEASIYPGFLPRYVITIDERTIAAGRLSPDGSISFVIPAGVSAYRTRIDAVFRPSYFRSPYSRVIPWTFTIERSAPKSTVLHHFVIDVGHGDDVVFVGSGFSYPEGAVHYPGSWINDRDFRWSRTGCQLRVPLVPGLSHRITLRGHVPVGFRVVSRGVELARFARPNSTDEYSFDVGPETSGGRPWLPITLINIDPMPLPNLDLRELFWGLDQVVVAWVEERNRSTNRALPAPSLLRAAFRAALQRLDEGHSPIPIALKARWDIPAGYKSAKQIAQEALNISAYGGAWIWSRDVDPPDTKYVAEQLIAPAWAAIAAGEAAATVGQPLADFAILIPAAQRGFARLRPSSRNEVLEPPRGAFQMMRELQRPTILIDERDLFERAVKFRCIVLPGPGFYSPAIWAALRTYVEGGGCLILTAGLWIPLAADEPASEIAGKLTGVALESYQRFQHDILTEHERVRIHNNDWLAFLRPATARVLHSMVTMDEPPDSASKRPAVFLNHVGHGQVLTLPFDIFGQVNRYNNTQYTRLFGELLDRLVADRLLTIESAPSLAATVWAGPRSRVVKLVNVARGHYDSGGLMNASRTFVFAEDIPPAPPTRIILRCPQKVVDVRTIPLDAGAKWSYADGRLTVDLSSVELSRTVIAELDAPLGLDPGRLALGRPAGNPLVTIDDAHGDAVSLVDALETPWPVERVQNAAHLWVGEGAAEGLRFKIACFRPGKFRFAMLVTPGHGRADKLRHLELALDGRIVWRAEIDDRREVAATLDLPAGVHDLVFYCTDKATVREHSNGDPRSLLIALNSVRITRSLTNPRR